MPISTILLIIVIIVLLYIVIRYVSSGSSTLSGLTSGTSMTTINSTDLAQNGDGNISSNFAYSIWFYVNDWNYRYGEPKVIFGRMGSSSSSGSNASSMAGIMKMDPCPAVILGPISNNLDIALTVYPGMDTGTDPSVGGCQGTQYGCCPDGVTAKVDSSGSNCSSAPTPSSSSSSAPASVGASTSSSSMRHNCAVPNVPIQKWVNLLISVYGRSLDVYLDGKLVKTSVLPGIAKINDNANVYITPNGGFSGWTSKFQYFSNSIDPQTAWNIYQQGYGASMLSNIFGKYQVKVSVVENGAESSSLTI